MFTRIISIFRRSKKTAIISNAITPCQEPFLIQRAEEFYQKGITFNAQEQYEDAIKMLQKAIELKANYPEALLQLADIFTKTNKIEEAINTYQLILVLNPANDEGYRSLAKIRQLQGNIKEALLLCQKSLELKNDVETRILLGTFLQYDGQLEEAIKVFKQVIVMDEKNGDGYNNLAVAFAKNNNYNEALETIKKAISLNGISKDFHNNLAYIYLLLRKYDLAIEVMQELLLVYPNSSLVKFNLSLAFLATGRYKEGWEKYEERIYATILNKDYKNFTHVAHLRLKPGDDVKNKTILVVTEQGLGDCIQFIRYIFLLQKLGATVKLLCYKPLVNLFSQIPALTVFERDDKSIKTFHYFCFLQSLPYFFSTTLETIPGEMPYLKAEPQLAMKWQQRILQSGYQDKLKIGLTWAGGTRRGENNSNDFYIDLKRSVNLSQLKSLGKIADIVFYSLQKGESQSQIKKVSPELNVIDYMDEVTDFADTAALIANLDLVITVDTAVAHLAGAMGKPTWILSRFDGCWRWLDGREDSPWYPSVRIFHQLKPGDWQYVIEKINAELIQWAKIQIPINFPQPLLSVNDYEVLAEKFYQQEQYEAAENVLQTAVRLQPNSTEILMKLGEVLEKLKKIEAAIEVYQVAIALNPNFQTLFKLGCVLQNDGKLEAALIIYQQALHLKEDVQTLNNLGMVLQHQGKIKEAISYFKTAKKLSPENPFVNSNLGMALGVQNQFDEMLELLEQAATSLPTSIEILNNLGSVYYMRREYHQSLEVFRRVLVLNPELSQAIFNLSLACLALGRYEEGWEKYEARWQISPLINETHWHSSFMSLQLQPGQDISGKTVFLICEQGLGDSLQFIRYLFLMKEKGAEIILYCPPELKRLFSQIPDIKITTEFMKEENPSFHYFCHLLRLPYFFRTTLETIPVRMPYLQADDKLKIQWQQLLQTQNTKNNLRVGLVWAGNARKGRENNSYYYADCRRSLHLGQLARLGKIPHINFYSLQKGEANQQINQYTKEIKIIDHTAQINDFADTAAFIANLDLIISVDTSVAHLAGAMNKPTWILSRFDGCWRWLDGRTDSPWYPSARLFHQTKPGEWENVIEQMALELSKWVTAIPVELSEEC